MPFRMPRRAWRNGARRPARPCGTVSVSPSPPRPQIVLLPGDGVGPEVAEQARLVLELLAPDVEVEERPIGAAAIRSSGDPLPEETLAACRAATAVLKGPV